MPDKNKHDKVPVGFTLRRTLRGNRGFINRIAWSPAGQTLAAASNDHMIRLWDAQTGELRQTLTGHTSLATTVTWSPDGRRLASGSDDDTIRLWDGNTGTPDRLLTGHTANVTSVDWSPGGQTLASGSDDKTIRVWHTETGALLWSLIGHEKAILSVAWSPDGSMLASASFDGTIRLWDAATGESHRILRHQDACLYHLAWSPDGQTLAAGADNGTIQLWDLSTDRLATILEGHTADVLSVSFSLDGRLLASKGLDDTIRFWRLDTWQTVAILPEEGNWPYSGMAFHPTLPLLATLGEGDKVIRIWEISIDEILSVAPSTTVDYYTNAKVVLVGDSGVGKSGLGLVLSGGVYEPTESTHGRRVWTFQHQEVELTDERKESREILLWDLAGQPGYRLIHQLHLNEIAVALVIFDAHTPGDPLSGVHYWNRALRQAQLVQGDGAPPFKKFLVAARLDRGAPGLNADRIETLLHDQGFAGYFATSAKEGWDIEELAEAIRAAVDWSALPRVSSPNLFQQIKNFLVAEKVAGRLLSTVDDLYRSFLSSDRTLSDTPELRAQFEICIRLVESRGLIRRLSFGSFILLQPELLDAYASALVNAAKEEREGLGSISERDARAGRFRISEDERITNRDQEELLLIATVEELLRHEITLRDDSYLVFPSQFTREWPESPNPKGKAVVFTFEGPILNIYATLAVRLSRSGFFVRQGMWENAATFTATAGGTCGMFLRERGEGLGQLTLFFDQEASKQTRSQFESYIHTYLLQKAVRESVQRRPILACLECGATIPNGTIELRRQRGFDWLRCPVCETRISLADPGAGALERLQASVIEIDKAADIERGRAVGESILQGKMATADFDVFLAHNSQDKPSVEVIAAELKRRGVNVWIDKEQVPPGRWFQVAIQEAIRKVKSAAIFIGPHGLGKWQALELRTFISQCVDGGLPVIPVLLPGVANLPPEFVFLQELNWVRFTEGLDEAEALDSLEWGITNRRPSHHDIGGDLLAADNALT